MLHFLFCFMDWATSCCWGCCSGEALLLFWERPLSSQALVFNELVKS